MKLRDQVLAAIEAKPGSSGPDVVNVLLDGKVNAIAACLTELVGEGRIKWCKDPRVFGHKDGGWKVADE